MGRNVVEETVLLAKSQVSLGTPVVPSAATDAMLVFDNGNIVQPNTSFIPKRPLKPSHTPGKHGVGRRLQKATIQTVLMCRGDTSGAPHIKPLLLAAGLQETFTAAAGEITYDAWKYRPKSKNQTPATLYSHQGGILHQVPDALGTYGVTGNAGEMLDANFDLTGLYVAPSTVANPTPTLPTDTKSMIENWDFTIGAYVPELLSFELTHGNNVPELRDANKPKAFAGVHITGREPRMTCRIRVEDTLANKDFFAYIDAQAALDDAAMDNISFTHPGANPAQSSLYWEAPSPMLIEDPTYENQDGLRIYRLVYLLRSNTDDGEYWWEFREENED